MATNAVPVALPGPGASAAHRIWQAPLVLPALAWTAGILVDRSFDIPLVFSVAAALALLAAWLLAGSASQAGLAWIYLLGAVAAVGAARHHVHWNALADDDLSLFMGSEFRPLLVRGIVATEPIVPKQSPADPLRAFAGAERTRFVLSASHLQLGPAWQPVSGLVQVIIVGRETGIHLHDEVEITGRLRLPEPPGNPGEFDYASFLRDQGIHSLLTVHPDADAVRVLRSHGSWRASGWLAQIGIWCKQVLDEAIPPEQSGVARALLLGDSTAMTGTDWEKYLFTGVIHVLAISGQHLVVLGAFAWVVLRLLGVRRRNGAIAVALFLMGYALLVGGRPPVMRSAWTVLLLCGGLLLQRPVMPANSFALAWLLVTIWKPDDAVNAGCLLSFLAVAVLLWSTQPRPDMDPFQRLVEESRPYWLRLLRGSLRCVYLSYRLNALVWLAVTPLIAERFHLVSPVALLIGPPVVVLSSLALLAGFLLLLLAGLCWPLAQLFGWLTTVSLMGCEALVDLGRELPGAFWSVPDIPVWWVCGFYLWLLAWLTLPPLRAWRYSLLPGLGWLCLGLVMPLLMPVGGAFRCTFLAVGHGGCTVIETPDGRVLLYDAGAITGPDVTRRQIAPFLWSRGIRRIDELFLSHADLDHFNGIPALLDRFALGHVTCTPSFADRETAAVRLTLDAFRRHGVPIRVVHAGSRLFAGEVDMRVLHPPPVGPAGNENSRSLVLLVHHAGHKILLTGDLEGTGLAQVLAQPPVSVDVLMAPHHGSATANTPELAQWAAPKLVVSCQGPPRSLRTEPYTAAGARFFGTWPHGALTIRTTPEGLLLETFRTREQWSIPAAAASTLIRRGD